MTSCFVPAALSWPPGEKSEALSSYLMLSHSLPLNFPEEQRYLPSCDSPALGSSHADGKMRITYEGEGLAECEELHLWDRTAYSTYGATYYRCESEPVT